jgi:hypothetical protein
VTFSSLSLVVVLSAASGRQAPGVLFCGVIAPDVEVTSAGPDPVVLEFRKTAGGWRGRFFERHLRESQPLEVQTLRLKDGLPHRVTARSRREPADFIDLTRESFHVWTGTWRRGDSKRRISLNGLDDGPHGWTYERARSRGTVPPAVTQPGPEGELVVTFVPQTPHSFHVRPVLGGAAPESMKTAFEAWVMKQGFAGDDDPCSDLYFTQQLSVEFLGPSLVVLRSALTGYFPGAAYPLNGEGGTHVFDLRLGRELRPIDVFRHDAETRKQLTGLFFAKELHEFRTEEAYLKELSPEERKQAEGEGLPRCYESEDAIEISEDFQWLDLDVSKGKIRLSRRFPHVSNACNGGGDWVSPEALIPFFREGTSFTNLRPGP